MVYMCIVHALSGPGSGSGSICGLLRSRNSSRNILFLKLKEVVAPKSHFSFFMLWWRWWRQRRRWWWWCFRRTYSSSSPGQTHFSSLVSQCPTNVTVHLHGSNDITERIRRTLPLIYHPLGSTGHRPPATSLLCLRFFFFCSISWYTYDGYEQTYCTRCGVVSVYSYTYTHRLHTSCHCIPNQPTYLPTD